jgi:predicted solute-binding protein
MNILPPVAMIPYTNMAPFRAQPAPAGITFVDMVPSVSVGALKAHRVSAAAVPVGGLPALTDDVAFLGRFGIGARERSMSVLFFSDRPFSEMDAGTAIRVTTDSASSVRLLYLLLGYACGFGNLPVLAGKGQPTNGELLIGDAALRRHLLRRNSSVGADDRLQYPHVTDLAGQWYADTGRPFVFARWVVRKDAHASLQRDLEDWLEAFRAHEPERVRQAAKTAAPRLGMPEAELLIYFGVLRRCLDETDLAGQALFQSEWRAKGVPGIPFKTPESLPATMLPSTRGIASDSRQAVR